MNQWIVTTRLFFLLALTPHAVLLAGCKAKCLPGHTLDGNSCKRIGTGTDGMESDASISDSGIEDAASPADAGAPSSQTEDAGNSSGGSASSADGRSTQEVDSGGPADAASAASNEAPSAEPCEVEGATRCAPTGAQGTREQCMGKVWTPSDPCGEAETCVMQADAAECAAVEKLCLGSKGQPVCDLQGTMLLCNEDGTVRSTEMCSSAKLCQDGIAAGMCATCEADKEYRCTDKTLERCDSDGMGFTMQQECETAALCNATVGQCTAAACVPGAFSCQNNTLKVCNADGTGFDESRSTPCGSGTCDAAGMDCNVCEPGTKMCMGDSPAVCDETGQSFQPMPCGRGMHCVGAGNCVECVSHDQCPEAADGCQEGVCRNNACTTRAAPNGKSCGGSSSCQNGDCCTPNCRNKCGGASDGCGGTCDAVCPPRCGNGIKEAGEICDGDCPTSCPDDGNACTRDVPRGAPCMIECQHEIIETGVENACGGCGTLEFTGNAGITGLEIGSYCQVGVGACFATGTVQCKSRPSNELICTAIGAEPTDEKCNGIDDNCNGVPDDDENADADCGPGMRCASGYGMCEPIP